ncbi:hypothetical protein NHX12_011962 [Muraenolepis orangiensis]|uniref:Uncharacterized protein n=1 Tax=Muraenolepis orangiensis TaxID=630683 RepID=A0A9Q0I788_9TELE|nr:hypothetical protein NHX12_011962 [Muraenolepis orangiensis]
MEVNLQKALAEASEHCTQECLILGHSDSCWMPQSNNLASTPTTVTTAASTATTVTTAASTAISTPTAGPHTAISTTTAGPINTTTAPAAAAINTTQGTRVQSGPLHAFGFQSWSRGGKDGPGGAGSLMDGRHTLGRPAPRKQEFYNSLDRRLSKKEEPVKVIPLASFSSSGQQAHGGSGNFFSEHQL